MEIKGTIVITDPCYMKNSRALMKRSTIYGDWSCMVYPGILGENKKDEEWEKKYIEYWDKCNISELSDEEKKTCREEFCKMRDQWLKENTLGHFTADAGMVGVFYWAWLDDKDKEWIEKHPWCAAVIKDFDGDVEFVTTGEKGQYVHVVGRGNKDFFSSQSGF